MKALGFDAAGILRTLSVAQMIEDDPEAARDALGVSVSEESPYATVDTEAQFDAALAAGRSIVLRGEGTGGVITLTGPKVITGRGTVIQGAAGGEEIRFAGLPVDARATTINADDVCLKNFKQTSTLALGGSNIQIGIYLAVGADEASQRGHRLRVSAVEMANWHTCMTKHGGNSSPYLRDVTIEDCYWHSAVYGGYLTFGLERLTLRRSRILLKLAGETHTSDNALTTNGNIVDTLIEDCTLGQCGRMGMELTTTPDTIHVRPRILRTLVTNVGSCGVSIGHATQAYLELVIVDTVNGASEGSFGFEFAGDDVTGRATITAVACEAKNITAAAGTTSGFVIDKANDCALFGCKVENVTSTPSNLANGVYVINAERAFVSNCSFMNGGATGVHLYRGVGSNTGGFHVVQGCTFRHSVNVASQQAVFASDINCVIRHNTAFVRPGGTLGYATSCTAGAAVRCDDAGTPVTAGSFTGSNMVISVPS
jgi:hypothetical protein